MENIIVPGRVNAIAGLEFKQQLPIVKDCKPDMDKHIMEVHSVLDCQTFGRAGLPD